MTAEFLSGKEFVMIEGFVVGLVVWVGPALIAWLILGPKKITRHVKSH